MTTPSNEQSLDGLVERRAKLMAKCGLDAFARPASDWLQLAVDAEQRGWRSTQQDYFEAALIRAKAPLTAIKDASE